MPTIEVPDVVTDIERDEWIVRLRKAGATSTQIAVAFGISRMTVWRIYREKTGARYEEEKQKHRRELFADIELIIENLRPWVHDDAMPPDEKLTGRFLQACKAKAVLMALDEPKEEHASLDISINFENPVAMEKAARVAAWAEITMGHPPPPPSVIAARPELAKKFGTPPIDASSTVVMTGQANGHVGTVNGHVSVWWRCVDNPELDEEDD